MKYRMENKSIFNTLMASTRFPNKNVNKQNDNYHRCLFYRYDCLCAREIIGRKCINLVKKRKHSKFSFESIKTNLKPTLKVVYLKFQMKIKLLNTSMKSYVYYVSNEIPFCHFEFILHDTIAIFRFTIFLSKRHKQFSQMNTINETEIQILGL